MRALAFRAVVAELDLTVTNRWMDAGPHTMQLDGTRGHTDGDGLHHGIEVTGSKTNSSVGLRLVQDGSQGGSRCSFTEITVETLSETWSEF